MFVNNVLMTSDHHSSRADIFIAGAWRAGGAGEFEVLDPATETWSPQSPTATRPTAPRRSTRPRPRAGLGDDRAARAVRAAPPHVRADAPRPRGLADLISAENGKALADARAEVTYAAEFFRWFAEEGVRTAGDYGSSPAGGTRTVVTHRPVGVAALVTPWNFPGGHGNTEAGAGPGGGVHGRAQAGVRDPAHHPCGDRLLEEAGLPAGVVNVVPTKRSGPLVSTWLADPRVRKISFTGSTEVGRVLLRQAADRVVNASMELGGNAPFVVTPDADLDLAVDAAMVAKFRGGGQACTAANRFYVHADVVAEFVERFGAAIEKLSVGPAREGTTSAR